MSRFLKFEKVVGRTNYIVRNKKHSDEIGYISFYKQWKKWVFEPAYDEIICDAECLRDIAEFMENLK